MEVRDNRVIAIRYKMKNSKGEVLENIMDGPPISYLHGSGNILPPLEINLFELAVGDTKTIFISKDQGYNGIDDDFYLEVIIDHIREATEKELMDRLPNLNTPDDYCGPHCTC